MVFPNNAHHQAQTLLEQRLNVINNKNEKLDSIF